MKHILPALLLLLLLAAQSCAPAETATHPRAEEGNSVYYWKTVFHLDSADQAFMRRHGIGRVYLRMFDVSADATAYRAEDKAVPNASVRVGDADYRLLRDSLSGAEFVPVVYITLDALKAMKGHEYTLATKIVERVRNMCEYNALPNVRELQLDCDWTKTTEASFFDLCKSVKQCMGGLGLPWELSSTIRLHQLASQAPPVDKGVLMVYNTGNFSDPDAANSIIDLDDVTPYLKHLPGYELPLDVAYPAYSWQLLFHKRKFAGLMNGLNLADTARFARRGENVYEARCDIPYNDRIIRRGDMVRQESSEFKDIHAVKCAVESKLRGRTHSNILYHLDNKNLSKYTPDEIDRLFKAKP